MVRGSEQVISVADLAECKLLYQLSGWNGQYWWWSYREFADGSGGYVVVGEHEAPFHGSTYPAYDAGYLLRRLPACDLSKMSDGAFSAVWTDYTDNSGSVGHSRTSPENALCRLAGLLFKEGILKGDAHE